jgi:hypothetical protein
MSDILSGTVSKLQFSSEVSGHVSGSHGRVQGSTHTKQVTTFRVDGKPAQIKLPGQPSISEGDVVLLAGKEKNGTFRARAMRNDTSGALDHPPTLGNFIGGGAALLLGLPLSLILIGLPFVAIGAWAIWDGLQTNKAIALLRSAPRIALAAR